MATSWQGFPQEKPLPAPSRRRFLALGAAAVAGTALTACREGRSRGEVGDFLHPTTGAPTDDGHTVSALLAETPFYVAHRGSGDNWTEHTMEAYSQAVAHGLKAIEVSVNATSDGVFICNHDTTLARLSGDPRKISQTPFASLAEVAVDARQWLGPAAQLEPIARLKDVLDKFAGSHVIFIEDKQGTNTESLLNLMDSYANPTEHFVWKQSARGAHTATVRSRGYRVWGYFDADQEPLFEAVLPTLDLAGLSVDATEETFRRLVAYGKPVIAWEVHTRSMRDRLQAVGVQGMMCSNVVYVQATMPLSTHDAFSTGLRAAGDLPWVTDKGWEIQPIINSAEASLRISTAANASYILGSLCPVRHDRYTLTVELRWPEQLPPSSEHAGFAFGQKSDEAYRVHIPSSVAGYHLILRPDGEIILFSRQAGETEGARLVSVMTRPIQAGEWVSLSVHISPQGIQASRGNNPQWTVQTPDTSYRGGYLSLGKNYVAPVPVEFRAITVT